MNHNNSLILLVHGFFKNYKDMEPLQEHLSQWGYHTHLVNLPTTFERLETIYEVFKIELSKINTASYSNIHMVGHSMGGLIIRYYLSKQVVPNLGRCVFIGTPNKGTRLADIGLKIPLLPRLLKPIIALHSKSVAIDLPLNIPIPNIGIIAGTNHRLITGSFLKQPNDGRVEVDATKLEPSIMTDFITLNYVHTQIHKESITARLVHNFIQNGRFGA